MHTFIVQTVMYMHSGPAGSHRVHELCELEEVLADF